MVAGDKKEVSVTKFDILSVDNSVLNENTGDPCNCFELVGFTVLEMLVMAILAFVVIMGLFRLVYYKFILPLDQVGSHRHCYHCQALRPDQLRQGLHRPSSHCPPCP